MSGLTQLLNTGVSGVLAATEAMQAASSNTANVNTPGYNIELVNQIELPGIAGQPGLGTQVVSIGRAFNQYAYQAVVQAGSANQAAQVTQTGTQTLSALFPVASGGANGLGAALSAFFAAANGVTQDPTSVPDRQVFLNSARTLASNFNSVGSQLSSNLTELGGQMSSAVQQINTLTQQIATCNAAIAAQSSSTAGAPNSLLDTRDNLVQQLGQEVGITLDPAANGAVDIYTTGGAALVSGNNAHQLVAANSASGDGSVDVIYAENGQDITAGLSGGTIGGLVASRSQFISAQDLVGALAGSLASAVNSQQSLGLDLNGALGGALFTTTGPIVTPASGNTGSATLTASITNTNAFIPGDFTITKTASGFQAVNTLTGQTTALGNGPSLSLDGMSIAVSGSAAVGDSFLLRPTAQAAQGLTVSISDPAKIAAAAPYVVSSGNNLGNVTASAGTPVNAGTLPAGTMVLPAGQFGQSLSIQFTSPTTFNVLSSGNAILASGSFSPVNGAEVAVAYPSPPAPAGEVTTITLSSGTAAAGDSFALTPGGIGSNANMAAMAGLAGQNLIQGQTLSSAYSNLVGTVGSDGQAASVAATAAQGILTQAQSVQQSISGVNLDEEAANLVNFQQAYQAAASMIGTAQTLFASLLSAVQAG